MSRLSSDISLDAKKLKCPLPLLKTKMALNNMVHGQILLVMATDSGSKRDIPRYIEASQHNMIAIKDDNQIIEFYIEVG